MVDVCAWSVWHVHTMCLCSMCVHMCDLWYLYVHGLCGRCTWYVCSVCVHMCGIWYMYMHGLCGVCTWCVYVVGVTGVCVVFQLGSQEALWGKLVSLLSLTSVAEYLSTLQDLESIA